MYFLISGNLSWKIKNRKTIMFFQKGCHPFVNFTKLLPNIYHTGCFILFTPPYHYFITCISLGKYMKNQGWTFLAQKIRQAKPCQVKKKKRNFPPPFPFPLWNSYNYDLPFVIQEEKSTNAMLFDRLLLEKVESHLWDVSVT